jgi:hypothetical protein
VRRAALAATLLLAATAVPACGGGGRSDEDQVRDIAKLIASSDRKVCDHITGALMKKSFEGSRATCVKSADENRSSGKIGAIKVDGERATAAISDRGDTTTFRFVKRDGEWKADDFAQ